MNITILFLWILFLSGNSATEDINVDNITVPNFGTFAVLRNSEITGTDWIVIQQRINGEEDFNRNWEAYKNGFGDFPGDFFLGLEKIHRLTNEEPHELFIHLERFNGNISFARYDNFRIAGEDDKYKLLSLGSYSGNAGRDRMRSHEHQKFSTFDSDNDKYDGIHCAELIQAGWWHKLCIYCNLNGKYYQQEVHDHRSNWWYEYYSLKSIKMLIHPRGN